MKRIEANLTAEKMIFGYGSPSWRNDSSCLFPIPPFESGRIRSPRARPKSRGKSVRHGAGYDWSYHGLKGSVDGTAFEDSRWRSLRRSCGRDRRFKDAQVSASHAGFLIGGWTTNAIMKLIHVTPTHKKYKLLSHIKMWKNLTMNTFSSSSTMSHSNAQVLLVWWFG